MDRIAIAEMSQIFAVATAMHDYFAYELDHNPIHVLYFREDS